MNNFTAALATVHCLKIEGVIRDYAIGGAAAELDFEGQPVRVIRPEYLIALYLEPSARTHKRLERVAALLEEGIVDRELLNTVLAKYKLKLPSYE